MVKTAEQKRNRRQRKKANAKAARANPESRKVMNSNSSQPKRMTNVALQVKSGCSGDDGGAVTIREIEAPVEEVKPQRHKELTLKQQALFFIGRAENAKVLADNERRMAEERARKGKPAEDKQ